VAEEVVEVVQRVAEVAKKLERLGRLRAEVERLAAAEVELFEVSMEAVPPVDVALNVGRQIPPASPAARLLAVVRGERGLRELVLERVEVFTLEEPGPRASKPSDNVLSVTVRGVAGRHTAETFNVRIPRRGRVTARLLDLLAISLLLEEGDWGAIAKRLEELEAEWGEVVERLRRALAALRVLSA